MTAKDKRAVRHYYHSFRGNMERTAEEAYASAKGHVFFLNRLKKMIAPTRRRTA